MRLCLHPIQPQALTLDGKMLTLWSLEGTPHITARLEIGRDWGHETEAIAMLPQSDQFAVNSPEDWKSDGSDNPNPVAYIDLRRWSDLALVNRIAIPAEQQNYYTFDFSPDGLWLAVGMYEYLLLLNRHTGDIVDWQYAGEVVSATVFDPASTYLGVASCGQLNGYYTLFTIRDGRLYQHSKQLDREGIQWPEFDLSGTWARMSFSPDSRWLAVYIDSTPGPPGSRNREWAGELMVYEVATGRRMWHRAFVPPNPVFNSDVVFTANGEYLICGSQEGHLFIFATADGQLVKRITTGATGPVNALARQEQSSIIWAVVDNQLRAFDPAR